MLDSATRSVMGCFRVRDAGAGFDAAGWDGGRVRVREGPATTSPGEREVPFIAYSLPSRSRIGRKEQRGLSDGGGGGEALSMHWLVGSETLDTSSVLMMSGLCRT